MGNKFLIKSGDIFFRFRNFLFPVFVISLILFVKPAFFLGNEILDKFAVTLGIIIALVGQIIRFSVIGLAYIKRGGKEGRVYADDLVTSGIYSHVRNPMYIGNFLILLGIGIIYGSIWIYLFVIPFFSFVYFSIIVTEENYLKNHFGEKYIEYTRQVSRFIPNLHGIKKTFTQFKFDFKKALRKDYGTIFGVIVGCYATWLWKKFKLYGFGENKGEIYSIVLAFILIIIFYSWVRHLKKSGKLISPS
ncbi:MAG: isoprenylcysteine carboxylmethyltransferase family protein [Candidatus Omnitrophota bacterium]